jgi:hypothetical protein
MPTKPVLPITELDFFQAKKQLKEFLRNDPSGRFRDIDFEGSNMSVLLDVLAYNTYQNNFYTNMAISEMFLDSAQLENSIVSHAKELNYLPRSSTSARAVVNLTITDDNNPESVIVIPENTRFTTKQDGIRFDFFNNETYVARKIDQNTYIAENIEIFEGIVIDEAFFVTGNRQSIRLLNENIDTSSIKVFENFDEPLDRVEYTFRSDIFGVNADDPVFYLEPGLDGTYEIVFGNNKFGKVPPQNTQVRVFYRVTNGEEANGACIFTTRLRSSLTGQETFTTKVTNVIPALGGASKETLEDIKFFAPKSIQVQERAVTQIDYEILLKQRFNEIKDVSVIGGDELTPPRFGKVAISVNIEGGLSDVASRRYESFLREKTPIGVQPIFLSPEFLYVKLVIDVFYSQKQTSSSTADLEREVRTLLREYNRVNLNKFGAIFEISRVSTLIDSLDPSIISNTIKASPYILYSPNFNQKESPSFDFGTAFETAPIFSRSNRVESYNSIVKSSNFIFNQATATFEDNGLGAIHIINARDRGLGRFDIIRRNAGSVDYGIGSVKLSDFFADFYEGNGIEIVANTLEKNVSAPKRRVLILNDTDIQINFKEVKER